MEFRIFIHEGHEEHEEEKTDILPFFFASSFAPSRSHF